MKHLEIKRVEPKSAFKTTLYFAIIPIIIMLIVGIGASIVGAAIGESGVSFFGIAYIIMSVFMAIIYGVFGALFAVLYNALAGKFGGLEISVKEDKDDITLQKKEL
ncbi:hypothetical protein [Anaeromicrobium sediminis]|uniref:DUF3566 domain-containing protein n=1 Tax=Anaeromicrobium sediminis TaxID=1478221 RepID=A0A267MHR4_9FIRM|nr:hypothetical protein [Anaeromicrobium sediminis]PAB58987.1 hypothetical protein CCE28_12450 [Anaeromicrobium sediminis]